MTEKELRKLKRSDFLQLLLAQGKDMSAVQARMEEILAEMEQVQETNDRLRAKLDEKDAQIERLKGRLDNKDATIDALRQEIEEIKESRKIELENAGSIAMASLRLNGIFEVAQKAADQYLYNIRLLQDELEAKRQTEIAKQEHLKKVSVPKPVPEGEGASHPAHGSGKGTHTTAETGANASGSDHLKQAPAYKLRAEGNVRPTQELGLLEKLHRHVHDKLADAGGKKPT